MKNSIKLYNTSKQILLLVMSLSFFIFSMGSYAQDTLVEKDIIEIRIYHLNSAEQENQVDNFLEKAYLPALERAGIKNAGVLKPIEGDTLQGKRIYVLTPFSTLENFGKIREGLDNDQKYLEDGSAYLKASHDKPSFERIETILLSAFKGMPRFTITELSNSVDRIYELRSYEAATEALLSNKVKMFDEGEIGIFERLGFNPVFFGEVLAGSQMPNLMYMTGFENKEARDAHWKLFGDDPVWKEMSVMEEYQNNVSHIEITMLRPAPYSKL